MKYLSNRLCKDLCKEIIIALDPYENRWLHYKDSRHGIFTFLLDDIEVETIKYKNNLDLINKIISSNIFKNQKDTNLKEWLIKLLKASIKQKINLFEIHTHFDSYCQIETGLPSNLWIDFTGKNKMSDEIPCIFKDKNNDTTVLVFFSEKKNQLEENFK